MIEIVYDEETECYKTEVNGEVISEEYINEPMMTGGDRVILSFLMRTSILSWAITEMFPPIVETAISDCLTRMK